MAINIVDMDLCHVAQVAQIEKNTFSEPWSEAQLSDLCNHYNSYARVIVDGDQNVLGYYSFNLVCDEGYINNIAVRQDCRGQGYGKKLLQDMAYTASLLNVRALTLEVRASNTVARQLYEKFGFINEGIRKKFYENTEDAIIYWLYVGGNNNSQS